MIYFLKIFFLSALVLKFALRLDSDAAGMLTPGENTSNSHNISPINPARLKQKCKQAGE